MADTATTLPSGIDGLSSAMTRFSSTLAQTHWTGWAKLAIAIFLGLTAGRIVQATLRSLANRFRARNATVRAIMTDSAAAPLSLGLLTAGLSVGLAYLVLDATLQSLVVRGLILLYTICCTWFLYNAVELVDVGLRRLTSRTNSTLDQQVVPLIARTLRVFLIVIFVLFTAQNVFGADITAWLAGLGIAGLAVSLAAQDSIKNLFGSITIFLDKAYAVNDRIVVGSHDGTVEEIGFRSTKIRTLEGAVVTIPNARIVDNSVANISRRRNIRRAMNITITYDTPPDKVEQAVRIVKDILAEPEIAQNFDLEKLPPRVAFDELNSDSLNIRVFYWFHPGEYWQYLEHAQRFNLKLIRAFEQAGIQFAFPTRTIYLANDDQRQLAVRMLSRDPGSQVD